MSYTGIHQHSIGSLLDGYSKVSDICKRANELGWGYASVTDHNHLLMIPELIQQAEKHNVVPILGCEMYFTPDTKELTKPVAQRKEEAIQKAVQSGEYSQEQVQKLKKADMDKLYNKFGYNTKDYHIIVLAKDQQGWNNLVKLQSEAARIGSFNGRYHCDPNLLEKYHEGIICTTACFPANSQVLTKEGYKNIQDITTKDFVMSHTGKFRHVRDTIIKQWNGAMVSFKCQYLRLPMISTDDHKYFVLRKTYLDHYTQYPLERTYYNKIPDIQKARRLTRQYQGEWIKAQDLQIGDNILIPLRSTIPPTQYLDIEDCRCEDDRNKRLQHLKCYKVQISSELLWLLGIFAAEGNWQYDLDRKIYRTMFNFHEDENFLYDKVTEVIYDIFGIKVTQYRHKNQHGYEITIGSKELALFFSKMFPEQGCQNKVVPSFIFSLSPEQQMYFLRGAWQGDGYQRSKRTTCYDHERQCTRCTYVTTSLPLCLGLQRILLANNIKPSIYFIPSHVCQRDGICRKDVYHLELKDKQNASILKRFIENGNYQTITRDKLYTKNIPVKVDGKWYARYEITELDTQTVQNFPVYCLSVAKDHSFTVNNIAVHNCVASYPAYSLAHRKIEEAVKYLECMQQIFGDDFYLEIQPHSFTQQFIANSFYMQYAKENGIKTIGSNDSHWTYKEDAEEHDVLLCIGTGQKVSTPRDQRMSYDPVYWIRSEEEMAEAFQQQANDMLNAGFLVETDDEYMPNSLDKYIQFYSEALSRTQEIADKVEPNIKLGSDHALFPSVKIPEGTTPEQVLKDKAFSGLGAYLDKHPECDKWQYMMQLSDELDVINKKGFAPYFLTVEEYINWCRDNEIPVGPGRGSAAASLVLFSTGITTNIDPIKDKLMFSRFLTVDRKDLPDVDADFSWLRRDEVVHHLEDYYGIDHVAHIGTVIAMKVKTAIKDVCRVLSIDFKESLQISKEIDALSDNPNLTFKEIDSWAETDPMKYDTFHKLEENYAKVFYYARKFEGIPRQIGVHASGILVTPMPVNEIFPLRYVDGTAVTLWDGHVVEACMAVKLDILGLKNLDCIKQTLQNIELTTGQKITLQDLYQMVDRNDSNIYKMIREKKTEGVFQIESNLMKGLADKIGVNRFEDLSAMIAIGRPGPLAAKADDIYSGGKNNTMEVTYPIHGCEDIFDSTYGAIIYQEQLKTLTV